MSAFHNVYAFLQMGGCAASVWSAYVIVFLLLIFRMWIAKRKLKKMQKTLAIRFSNADPS
ncbi:MAG: heme exporter protein CcmD [Proteobacteria bacterium]|nr:heme exporter protein CcmD [Pseudomonadota bacterium]